MYTKQTVQNVNRSEYFLNPQTKLWPKFSVFYSVFLNNGKYYCSLYYEKRSEHLLAFVYVNLFLCCTHFRKTTAGVWNTSKHWIRVKLSSWRGMTTMIWQPPLLRGNLGKSLSHQKIHWSAAGFSVCEIRFNPSPKEEKSPTPQNKQNKRNRYLNREIDMQILS